MAGRNVFGLAWFDANLIVTARYGSKAGFIRIGEPIPDSVIPLIGSESEILALQHDPAASIELPGVVIHAASGDQERYNLSLFWDPSQTSYVLLIARASLDAALEVELLRHVRFRLMAEEEIKAKSSELARANRDLEDFAAIISHDLKAPMRALKYMTDDLEETIVAGRKEDARTKLAWIRSQSQRMSSMLSALLDYSSIGRKARAHSNPSILMRWSRPSHRPFRWTAVSRSKSAVLGRKSIRSRPRLTSSCATSPITPSSIMTALAASSGFGPATPNTHF